MEQEQRRKKRKGFGYYLYAFVALILMIVNILLGAYLLFYVRDIEVKGNTYSSEYEVLNLVWEDPKTSNSIYALWKLKSGSYDKPAYLETLDVTLIRPWKLGITVTEKEMVGCIAGEGQFLCFDREGMVLQKSTELKEGIPIIEGISCGDIALYKTIPLENEHAFSYIVNLTEELEKRALHPDRIVWEEDGMQAYFGQVCVKFGKSGFDDKVLQLTAIIEELEGREGILHLEHYSKTSNSISFEPKKDKKQ